MAIALTLPEGAAPSAFGSRPGIYGPSPSQPISFSNSTSASHSTSASASASSSRAGSFSSSSRTTTATTTTVDPAPDVQSNLPTYQNSLHTTSASAIAHAERNERKQAIRDTRAGRAPRVRITVPSDENRDRDKGRERNGDAARRQSSDGSWVGVDASEETFNIDDPRESLDDPVRTSMSSGILPDGMDVRDALARCEDPGLGWSLQFWITIEDPVTGHTFHACPATGQTSWTAPTGVFVVPRQAEGEWWELADTTRGNRSYFYNTLTKCTQWTRPGGDAFVVPLGLIQSSTLPKRTKRRSSASHLKANDPTSPLARPRSHTTSSNSPITEKPSWTVPSPDTPESSAPSTPTMPMSGRIPRPPQSPGSPLAETRPRLFPINTDPAPKKGYTHSPLASSSVAAGSKMGPIMGETDGFRPLSVVGEEMSGNEADDSVMSDTDDLPTPTQQMKPRQHHILTIGESGRQQATARSSTRSRLSSLGKIIVPAKMKAQENMVSPLYKLGRGRGSSVSIASLTMSRPIPLTQNNLDMHEACPALSPILKNAVNIDSHEQEIARSQQPVHVPLSDIYDGADQATSLRTKRLSTGLHPILPALISDEIHAFQLDSFASQYFAKRRAGLMRQIVPVATVLKWQKGAISAPLLEGTKAHSKEAVIGFKVVQRTMGERDRPVDGARPLRASSSVLNLLAMPVRSSISSDVRGRDARTEVLEEIRWLIQVGVIHRELRNEVYAQTIKQITDNPDREAIVLGMQLLCVLVNAFGASKDFEPFVYDFLSRQSSSEIKNVSIMAKYCVNRLHRAKNLGLRAHMLTTGEIEHASDAAFYPSLYGDSLEAIMQRQEASYAVQSGSVSGHHEGVRLSMGVPVILPFLATAIINLGGLRAEGIFRIPGDAEAVAELRSRMDRGHYQMAGIDDPHIAASLFKLFLRELAEPVVHRALYNEALASSATPADSIAFLKALPMHHRRLLIFVIFFIHRLCENDVIWWTKMTPHNLALVLAPNILRTTSESLVTVYTNSAFESKWILTLLSNLRAEDLLPEDRFILDHL